MAQRAEAREKTTVEAMMVCLRPSRSLRVPEHRAPISMPNVAYEPTSPALPGLMPSAFVSSMCGSTEP